MPLKLHPGQVTDTPGLLARANAERNAMERLTLACLAHLPTRVLFVMDLTAECGTSVVRSPSSFITATKHVRHAVNMLPVLLDDACNTLILHT